MLSTTIIIAFGLSCLINTIYWTILCVSLNRIEEPKLDVTEGNYVTILVCSKNDSNNVKTLLKYLNQQIKVTTSVKVLIVNDFSDAYHSEELKKLNCRFPITLIHPKENLQGKKAALLSGLKSIKEGIILLTDADCRPRPEWISTLSSQVQLQGAVLGYSPFARQSSLVNIWVRYEGYITALQYLGWAALNKPYLGVGRSIGLQSQAITQLSIEDLNPTIASGDDDMLIQYLQSAIPSVYPAAYVDTDSPATWKAYWTQKRRHYSISPSYPLKLKIRLSTFSFSQILIFVLGIVSVIMKLSLVPLTVWCIRMIWIALVSRRTFVQLEQKDLWFLLPILDGLLSIYYLVFGLTFLLPKPKSW